MFKAIWQWALLGDFHWLIKISAKIFFKFICPRKDKHNFWDDYVEQGWETIQKYYLIWIKKTKVIQWHCFM